MRRTSQSTCICSRSPCSRSECGPLRLDHTQHKETQTAYTKYLRAQEAGKELLLYSVGNDALAPLKKQYINFRNSTMHSMILHLCERMAIKMTTSHKLSLSTKPRGTESSGIQQQEQWSILTASTSFKPLLPTTVLQQAPRKLQWRWAQECGRVRCY
jgi:hypothetical protein